MAKRRTKKPGAKPETAQERRERVQREGKELAHQAVENLNANVLAELAKKQNP